MAAAIVSPTAFSWSSGDSAKMRLVCRRWRQMHDAHLQRLQPSGDPAMVCARLGASKLFPSLRALDLGGCAENAVVGEEQVQAALQGMRELTRLDFGFCLVDDAALLRVAECCTDLQELVLSGTAL